MWSVRNSCAESSAARLLRCVLHGPYVVFQSDTQSSRAQGFRRSRGNFSSDGKRSASGTKLESSVSCTVNPFKLRLEWQRDECKEDEEVFLLRIVGLSFYDERASEVVVSFV